MTAEPTTQRATAASNEAHIRRLIDERATAIRAKDVAGAMAGYAPEVLSYDVVDPLCSNGSAAATARAESWFSTFDGPIGYEIRDLTITAGEDVAFCHFLYRVGGTLTAGGAIGMWVRATEGYAKIDGVWRVTHQHNSVPFNPTSGKASLDLEP